MDFGNLYNLKTEQMNAWNPPGGTSAHITELPSLNPFVHWASRGLTGLVSSTTPAAATNIDTKPDPNTLISNNAMLLQRAQQQVITSSVGHNLQGNYILPINSVPTVSSGGDAQHHQSILHSGHQPPVSVPHQPQVQHQGVHNDTAFPGAGLRQYSVNLQPHHQQIQAQHLMQQQQQQSSPQPTQPDHNIAKVNNRQDFRTQNSNGVHDTEVDIKPNLAQLERLYNCTECPKKFTREAHLKRHAWTHTNEQPEYRCEVPGCNKSYTRKERLNIHLKHVHLGQCDYSCPVCGRDFQRKEHMQRHVKKVHGPKPEKPPKAPTQRASKPKNNRGRPPQLSPDSPISMLPLPNPAFLPPPSSLASLSFPLSQATHALLQPIGHNVA